MSVLNHAEINLTTKLQSLMKSKWTASNASGYLNIWKTPVEGIYKVCNDAGKEIFKIDLAKEKVF